MKPVEKHLLYGVKLKRQSPQNAVKKKNNDKSIITESRAKKTTGTDKLVGIRHEGPLRDLITGDVVVDDLIQF